MRARELARRMVTESGKREKLGGALQDDRQISLATCQVIDVATSPFGGRPRTA